MNILLWVLQLALALLYLAGGAYKVFSLDELAKQFSALARDGWRALSVFEMVGALLLVVPAAANRMSVLTPLAAAVLAAETLALAGPYARYSLRLNAEDPLVWAVVMGLLTAFVACGWYTLTPDGRPACPRSEAQQSNSWSERSEHHYGKEDSQEVRVKGD